MSDRVQELKNALGAVLDLQRPVFEAGMSDLKIDVKYDREGRLSRILLWPEFEYHVRRPADAGNGNGRLRCVTS